MGREPGRGLDPSLERQGPLGKASMERPNAQNAADPVYLDGMVWLASYALATGLERAKGCV